MALYMPAVGASADWLSNDLLAVGDLAGCGSKEVCA